MSKQIEAVLIFLLSTVFTACDTTPVALPANYAARQPQQRGAPSHERQPKSTAQAAEANSRTTPCSLHLNTLEDLRSDPTILGSVAGRTVLSPGDSDQWIKEMLRSGLEHYGIQLSIAPQTPNSGSVVTADGKILTAWVRSISTSMNSNVVVAMSYKDAGTDNDSTYRGTKTQMNWASGNGEIQTLVNAAFTELLVKLAADVRQRCVAM